VRGQKVLLDADLARLYGVSTGRLNEQVKRNLERFPADFLFQLTKQEVTALRSQFAMSNAPPGRGGRRHAPFTFAEHGAIMAATVLNAPRAIEMSLYVVRPFVRLREMIIANKALAARRARAAPGHPRPGDRRDHAGHPRAHRAARASQEAAHRVHPVRLKPRPRGSAYEPVTITRLFITDLTPSTPADL